MTAAVKQSSQWPLAVSLHGKSNAAHAQRRHPCKHSCIHNMAFKTHHSPKGIVAVADKHRQSLNRAERSEMHWRLLAVRPMAPE